MCLWEATLEQERCSQAVVKPGPPGELGSGGQQQKQWTLVVVFRAGRKVYFYFKMSRFGACLHVLQTGIIFVCVCVCTSFEYDADMNTAPSLHRQIITQDMIPSGTITNCPLIPRDRGQRRHSSNQSKKLCETRHAISRHNGFHLTTDDHRRLGYSLGLMKISLADPFMTEFCEQVQLQVSLLFY